MKLIFNEETERKVHKAEGISKKMKVVSLTWFFLFMSGCAFMVLHPINPSDPIAIEILLSAIMSLVLLGLGYIAPDIAFALFLGLLASPIYFIETRINKNLDLKDKANTVKEKLGQKSKEDVVLLLEEWIQIYTEDKEIISEIEDLQLKQSISRKELHKLVKGKLRLDIWFARNAEKGLLEHKKLVLDSLEGLPEILEFLKESTPLNEKHIILLERNLIAYRFNKEKAPE